MGKPKHVAVILVLIGLAWGAIGLAVPLLGQVDEVAVPFPNNLQIELLPDSVRILSYDDKIAVFASEEPELASQLYKAGAWAVLPTSNGSCLKFSETSKPQRKRLNPDNTGLSGS
ncbi:hypothetical protein PsW64_03269 [Pseudovibrio sp. W64]|uniref:hypothetical protein n=1 Tax=Pseudovibrio sp. W64 TaxID=1735583 RepID=UPI0007AEC350|nr:hypothetical protein [Pseudovibrio sp. W64]KZK79171.1 hypothetical protein PsW64_03269 [Pseudovibrio sp. W64]